MDAQLREKSLFGSGAPAPAYVRNKRTVDAIDPETRAITPGQQNGGEDSQPAQRPTQARRRLEPNDPECRCQRQATDDRSVISKVKGGVVERIHGNAADDEKAKNHQPVSPGRPAGEQPPQCNCRRSKGSTIHHQGQLFRRPRPDPAWDSDDEPLDHDDDHGRPETQARCRRRRSCKSNGSGSSRRWLRQVLNGLNLRTRVAHGKLLMEELVLLLV